ncbi:Zinc finger C2H2-type [Arabidopsis thaliana x Arabidopsis arenosa]|uniref:Zinc finger C2H2-type n=1 Tax=Arabidopsis thaliana x Arabidopsis arenosa TaxID=1240361 RepID=A0A8T1XPP8_9BRAS|nr:Zinc finger C2H2-type [Arabidopsis thaliana x Arabidopsis arenosa]
MENQSMSSSSSSSSPQKPDQKLKSPVVTVEEKETRDNPEQRSPQEVVAENTILELPTFRQFFRTKKNTVLYRPMNNKIHICDFCHKVFQNGYALGGHVKCHKKERELEKQWKLSGGTSLAPFPSFPLLSSGPFMYGQGGSSYKRKMTDSMPSGGTSLAPFQCFPFLSSGPFMYGQGGSSSTDDINLELTLGPSSKSIGGSNNNTNPSFYGNLFTPMRPCVSGYNFGAGNPVDPNTRYLPPYGNNNLCPDLFSLQGNGSGFSPSKSLFLMAQNKAMVPPFASPYPTTNLCYDLFNGWVSSHSSLISKGENRFMVHPFAPPYGNNNVCPDLFSLQENGMGSSHSKSLISMEKNIAMVPPFAPSNGTTTDLLLSSQVNGSGSSHSKSLISKGEKEVVVIEDDDDEEEEEDIVTMRWLAKKKRSRRE